MKASRKIAVVLGWMCFGAIVLALTVGTFALFRIGACLELSAELDNEREYNEFEIEQMMDACQ